MKKIFLKFIKTIPCVLLSFLQIKKVQNPRGFFWLSQNGHFYSYVLVSCDVKFVASWDNFSSKFNCPIIEKFGTVSHCAVYDLIVCN